MHTGDGDVGARLKEPWFRWRPDLAVAVGVALYGAVFALRLAVHGASEAISLLFVLPIALLALAFGARIGWLAGAVGVLLVTLWVAIEGVSLTPLGWTSRAVPLLLLGGLVGAASDRIRAAAETERRLLLAEVRQRDAAEINDAIIQRLAVAKWAMEAGDDERAVSLVSESIETAQALVGDLLTGQSDATRVRANGQADHPAGVRSWPAGLVHARRRAVRGTAFRHGDDDPAATAMRGARAR